MKILGMVILIFCCASVGNARPWREEKIQKYEQTAEQCFEEEDYAKAARLYRRLEKLSSASTERRAGWMAKNVESLVRAHKTQKAYEASKHLLQQYPLYVDYAWLVPNLRKIAERYVDGDGTFWGTCDKNVAIAIYEQILMEAPSIHHSMADRLRLAELLDEMKRYGDVVATYQEILQLEPERDDVRLKLAKLLLQLARSGDGDGARLRAAVREANIILQRNEYSGSEEVRALLHEAKEMQAQRLLDLAKFYLGSAQYRPYAARVYIFELRDKYQDTVAGKISRILLPAMESLPEPEVKLVK